MVMVRSLLTLPFFRGFRGGFLFGLDGLGFHTPGFEERILFLGEVFGGFNEALHACDSCLGAGKHERRLTLSQAVGSLQQFRHLGFQFVAAHVADRHFAVFADEEIERERVDAQRHR